MSVSQTFVRLAGMGDCCPWGTVAGRTVRATEIDAVQSRAPALYTVEERRRRDATPWTTVQAILAPLQFAVFALSLGFVLRTLFTGEGATAANASVVIKTMTLYTIMVTGAIWEKKVFGRYLFAPAFWWEDAFSMVVIALHTAYLWALFTGSLDQHGLLAAGPVRLHRLCRQRHAVRHEAARGASPAGAHGGLAHAGPGRAVRRWRSLTAWMDRATSPCRTGPIGRSARSVASARCSAG